MNRTLAIILVIVFSLLCGIPGIIITGLGLLAGIASLFPETFSASGGTQQQAMLGSLMMIGLGVVLLLIPIAIGLLTLRKKKPSLEWGRGAQPAPAAQEVPAWEPPSESQPAPTNLEDTDEAPEPETHEAAFEEQARGFKDKGLALRNWSTYLNIGDESGVQSNFDQVFRFAKMNPPAFPLYIERAHLGGESVLALIYPLRNEDNMMPDQPSYKTISGWLEGKQPWDPFGAWHSSYTGTDRLREYCTRATSVEKSVYFKGD